MIQRIHFAIVLVLAARFPAIVDAQEAHHPEITIAHPGVAGLKADLEKLLSYTTPQEREQLQNVIDFVDLFAFGLDPDRPIRVDMLTGVTPTPYVVSAAYKNDPELAEANAKPEDQLMENLDSNYITRKVADNLFELLPPDQGWLRLIPGMQSAILVLTTEEDHALLKQLIQKMADPLATSTSILEGGGNIGIGLQNKALTAEDQTKRAESFSEIRALRLDAIQKRPSESATAYDLRKGFVDNQLDELQRLLVEGLNLKAVAFLNSSDDTAAIRFSGEAIPETSLDKSIRLFHQNKDRFASIAPLEDSVLSGRMNHPVDELRQKNAAVTRELMRKDIEDRIAKAAKLNDVQKKAAQQLFDEISTLVLDGLNSGYVNGFIESKLDDQGKFVTVGAVSSVNGQRLNDTLKLVSQTGEGNTFESGVAKVGDIDIHRIKLSSGFVELFDRIVGDEQEFYIGVSSDVTWFATGTDSLELLKKTAEGLKQPEDTDVIIKVDAHLLPWVRHWEKVAKEKPEPTAVEDKQPWRDRIRRLGQAVESYRDKDDLHIDMKAENGKLSGEIQFNTGTLRFVGKLISTFSKENFE